MKKEITRPERDIRKKKKVNLNNPASTREKRKVMPWE